MRKISIKSLGAIALTAGLALAGPAFSAIYMKYSGVDGDVSSATATREGHAGWIILESVSFTNPLPCGQSGRGVAAARMQSANNLRQMGTAATGAPIPRLIIEIDNPTGGTALRYELENALITSVQAAPPPGSTGDRPSESLTINFTKITYKGGSCRAKLLTQIGRASFLAPADLDARRVRQTRT